jgi:hypothetical protein
MRVLEIRSGFEGQDIAEAREVLDMEIGHPSKNVMLVLGSSPEAGQLADRGAIRSNPFPHREVIWIRSDEILNEDEMERWFGGQEEESAVVLDFGDRPVDRLPLDATLFDIERAFLIAQGIG